MSGWHPDGYPGNLAYSPELWEWMDSLGFYLNYDPSHLVWLGVDPVRTLREHVGRVLHVQAKDTEILPEVRNRYGFYGQAMNRSSPWELGWWRYRVPGRGDVDWRGILDALYEGGYDGMVAVAHEDPVWSDTAERVNQGLEVARRTLALTPGRVSCEAMLRPPRSSAPFVRCHQVAPYVRSRGSAD